MKKYLLAPFCFWLTFFLLFQLYAYFDTYMYDNYPEIFLLDEMFQSKLARALTLSIFAAVTYSIFLSFDRKVVEHYHMPRLVFGSFILGTVLFFLHVIATQVFRQGEWNSRLGDLAYFIVFVLLGILLPSWLLLKYLDPEKGHEAPAEQAKAPDESDTQGA